MYIISILFLGFLVFFDQMTKIMAIRYIKPAGSIKIMERLLNFTFVENRGAAFGMFQGGRWFFVVLTVVLVLCIGIYYVKLPKTKIYNWVRFSLLLITAGAIGNWIDRFFNGYVVDFIHVQFIDFPVFNMADIFVVCGVILLGLLLIFFLKEEPGTNLEIPSEPVKTEENEGI